MLNNKDKMHPDDIRNIIIFGIISILLWTVFEIYVLQPKKEAIQPVCPVYHKKKHDHIVVFLELHASMLVTM